MVDFYLQRFEYGAFGFPTNFNIKPLYIFLIVLIFLLTLILSNFLNVEIEVISIKPPTKNNDFASVFTEGYIKIMIAN